MTLNWQKEQPTKVGMYLFWNSLLPERVAVVAAVDYIHDSKLLLGFSGPKDTMYLSYKQNPEGSRWAEITPDMLPEVTPDMLTGNQFLSNAP